MPPEDLCDRETDPHTVSFVRSVVGLAAVILAVAALAGVAAGATETASEVPRDGPVLAPAESSIVSTPANETPEGVIQTVTYVRTPNESGSFLARHSYRVGPDVSTLIVYDYERTSVEESNGFVRQPNGRWMWDERTPEPSLTLRTRVNRSGRNFRGFGWVDAGEWGLANPQTAFTYRSANLSEWVYSWEDTGLTAQRTRIAGEGFAGSSILFLGNAETITTNRTDHSIRVVHPRVAAMAERPARVLGTIDEAARQLRVGGRKRAVNVFVGPEPLREGGVTARASNDTQDLWVSANESLGTATNTWIHEYVHTRQNASLGPDMEWFREASATYYERLLSIRQGIDGRAGFERFVASLRRETAAGDVLANPATWSSPVTPYEKGHRVLAALDVRIRNATDSERTLQDVFRRMNDYDETVGYSDFERFVVEVSDESQSRWLGRHVQGQSSVSPPTSPHPYTAADPASDADGDGITGDVERDLGTHQFDPDTDSDGLEDGNETEWVTDPLGADTDGDGLEDGREVDYGADPTVADTDDDGVDDGAEFESGSDPGDVDTDGDGYADGVEVRRNSDPADPYSTPIVETGRTNDRRIEYPNDATASRANETESKRANAGTFRNPLERGVRSGRIRLSTRSLGIWSV